MHTKQHELSHMQRHHLPLNTDIQRPTHSSVERVHVVQGDVRSSIQRLHLVIWHGLQPPEMQQQSACCILFDEAAFTSSLASD